MWAVPASRPAEVHFREWLDAALADLVILQDAQPHLVVGERRHGDRVRPAGQVGAGQRVCEPDPIGSRIEDRVCFDAAAGTGHPRRVQLLRFIPAARAAAVIDGEKTAVGRNLDVVVRRGRKREHECRGQRERDNDGARTRRR